MYILEMQLKALTPIAITKRVFGPLYETELFIPAWTMWHTFAKLFALKNGTEYEDAENKLENIRLTNFYIIENGDVFIPFGLDSNDGVSFDKKKYVSSDSKTSINPLTNTSLFNALYEREYIKKEKFVGWIKLEDKILKEFFTSLEGSICFIGADKNTGFGKVIISQVSENFSEENKSDVKGENSRKIKNALSLAQLGGNSLIPPEFDKEYLFFPLTIRKWDKDKGQGMKIVLIKI